MVQSIDPVKVITVRTTGFDAAAEGGNAAIEPLTPTPEVGKSAFMGREVVKSDRPELTAAKVIVSGGRCGVNLYFDLPATAAAHDSKFRATVLDAWPARYFCHGR
jgi:hypothetical protein